MSFVKMIRYEIVLTVNKSLFGSQQWLRVRQFYVGGQAKSLLTIFFKGRQFL